MAAAPGPSRAPGHGGAFTTGEPWLPLVADAARLNVESQATDPRSTLWLVRRLAASPALQTGGQRTLDAGADVLAWVRAGDGERLLVAINFSPAPQALRVSAAVGADATPGDRARPGSRFTGILAGVYLGLSAYSTGGRCRGTRRPGARVLPVGASKKAPRLCIRLCCCRRDVHGGTASA